MYKKVNIQPQGTIFTLKVPVTGPMIGVTMSVGDIAMCLHGRALVSEILPDGKLVKLSLSNYNKDNTIIKEEIKAELPGLTEVIEGVKRDADEVIPKEEVKKIETKDLGIADVTNEEAIVIKEVSDETKKEEEVTEKVNSIDRDPLYFKEIEKQKQKIKK